MTTWNATSDGHLSVALSNSLSHLLRWARAYYPGTPLSCLMPQTKTLHVPMKLQPTSCGKHIGYPLEEKSPTPVAPSNATKIQLNLGELSKKICLGTGTLGQISAPERNLSIHRLHCEAPTTQLPLQINHMI